MVASPSETARWAGSADGFSSSADFPRSASFSSFGRYGNQRSEYSKWFKLKPVREKAGSVKNGEWVAPRTA
jgi:hypothetical protein